MFSIMLSVCISRKHPTATDLFRSNSGQTSSNSHHDNNVLYTFNSYYITNTQRQIKHNITYQLEEWGKKSVAGPGKNKKKVHYR